MIEKVPPAPKDFTARERKQWAMYCKYLLGRISDVHLVMVRQLVELESRVTYHTEKLKEEGEVQTTRSGYKQPHPSVNIISGIYTTIMRLKLKLGLTPADEGKVSGGISDADNFNL